MRFLSRFRRHSQKQQPYLQGEDYEIVKAERTARRQRERFADSLIEKAGHANYPFKRDPFE